MNETEEQKLPPGWAVTSLGTIVEPRTGKADPQATPAAKFIGMEQVEPHTQGSFPSQLIRHRSASIPVGLKNFVDKVRDKVRDKGSQPPERFRPEP